MSMEARLREASASQDSLQSSGSNQELQHQLDTTIAQVEAFALEFEKRKMSLPSEALASTSNPIVKPNGVDSDDSANKARSVSIGGARPRVSDRVVLRQSSWGSREHVTAPEALPSSTSAARSLWDKKVEQKATVTKPSEGSGFRTNKDFWEQKVNLRQKHTPDLVLDLPVSSGGTSTPSTSSSPSSASSATAQPVPKPRTLSVNDQAEQFAKADHNTMRKTSNRQSPSSPTDSTLPVTEEQRRLPATKHVPFQASSAQVSGSSSSSTFVAVRPQVRVKPQIQGRKQTVDLETNVGDTKKKSS